jgi:uncharacterized protein YjbI with pentapeptide repeats
MVGVSFEQGSAKNSNFTNANIVNGNFDGCDLTGSDFTNANLVNTTFEKAITKDVNWAGAKKVDYGKG